MDLEKYSKNYKRLNHDEIREFYKKLCTEQPGYSLRTYMRALAEVFKCSESMIYAIIR